MENVQILESLSGAIKTFNSLLFIDKGVYIPTHKLIHTWPSDVYRCGFPFYCARVMKGKRDYIDEREEKFDNILRYLDFEANYIVLIRAEEEAITNKHYHITRETFTVLEGKAIEQISQTILLPGKSYTVNCFTPHQYYFPTNTSGIIQIPKHFVNQDAMDIEWYPQNDVYLNQPIVQ